MLLCRNHHGAETHRALSRCRRSLVGLFLGNEEVECSIHSGSTIPRIASSAEKRRDFKRLRIIDARATRPLGLPANTRTNRETPARVTRFWHAKITRATRSDGAGIAGGCR